MNCDIIKDLIPLCSEGLCSEESQKEVKEHIKDCEGCRTLYESGPVTEGELPETPDEKNIFKKVNKKLKRHRILDIVLLLITAAIIIGLGYLTYGQITKKTGCQSFETIFQTLEVRKIANYIAEGDAESFLESLYTGYENNVYTIGHASSIRKNDIEAFNKHYAEAIGNKKITDISVDTYYSEYEMLDDMFSQVCSDIIIELDDGTEFNLSLVKEHNGRYTNSLIGTTLYHEEDYTKEEIQMLEFENVVDFASSYGARVCSVMNVIFEHHLTTADTVGDLEKRCDSISIRFSPECRDTVRTSTYNYFDKGFAIENIIASDDKFDADKNSLYCDIFITGSDSSGSAVMQTRLYFDHTGLYSPDSEDTTIYANGCTPELEEALREIFG